MGGTLNSPKLVTYRLTLVFGIAAVVLGALTIHWWLVGSGVVLLGIGIALRSRWGKEK